MQQIKINGMTRQQVTRLMAFLFTLQENIEADIKHYGPEDETTDAMEKELDELGVLAGLLETAQESTVDDDDDVYDVQGVYKFPGEMNSVETYDWSGKADSVENAVACCQAECIEDNEDGVGGDDEPLVIMSVRYHRKSVSF